MAARPFAARTTGLRRHTSGVHDRGGDACEQEVTLRHDMAEIHAAIAAAQHNVIARVRLVRVVRRAAGGRRRDRPSS